MNKRLAFSDQQSAKGPNPEVVGKIWNRFVEWQIEEQDKSAVIGDQSTDDQTPTQKIWKPVSDLDLAQQAAFKDMLAAMSNGNLAGAKDARERIQAIEDQQKMNHAAARQYLIRKMVQR